MIDNAALKLFRVAAAALVVLASSACTNTVRIASHGKLSTIDPIWTTAYVARSHGYLVYDTLFALDEYLQPQPQMVDSWTVSEDGKTWTFRLREGLQWHDGSAVTAEDCVASLARWSKRDGMGQQLFKDVVDLSAADDKTFVMTLRQPYGQVLESLGKPSANVPFMMPKRIAQTDPMQPIEDATGSGPFIFKRDEWQDSKAVYIRNPDYKPRPEPQSLAAGGKVVKVERLEWIYFPDQAEAVRSLLSGKIDYMESPSTKLIPMLEGNPQVVVASADPIGNLAMARFNHLQPPFDKADVRRAVLLAMRQEDYMTAALGDPRYWKTCYSVFPCGTTFANQAGSEVMATGNVEAAKKALQAAGYDGTPVVLLNPVDAPVMSALTQITAELLQKIGMKVQVENLDWASLLERRNNRGPVSEGGWSMFHTWWIAADVTDPLSIAFSGDPETGWYGWMDDQRLEALRTAFATASSLEEKQRLAVEVQERLWAIGAFGVLGQFPEPVAFRADLTGITAPMQFYWGVSRGD